MRLRVEFHKAGTELPPPRFLDDPSEQLLQRTQSAIKNDKKRGTRTGGKHRVREVGENHHSSKPILKHGAEERHPKRSPEKRKNMPKSQRTRSIELGPFVKWIQNVSPDPSLKIPQFVLYSGLTRPLEHVCRYKSAMRLVTNDKVILCKAFPSTLSDKALTWFTSLRAGSIDSWYTSEKVFLNKFSTAGIIQKTRGDLANIKQ